MNFLKYFEDFNLRCSFKKRFSNIIVRIECTYDIFHWHNQLETLLTLYGLAATTAGKKATQKIFKTKFYMCNTIGDVPLTSVSR